jgi:genome maintenance exonuclease 1
MILMKPYDYPKIERVTNDDGTRFYTCPQTEAQLPSVTTILSATSDDTGLLEWREWIGNDKADAIVKEACDLGTLMHTHLENHVDGVERPGGTNMIRKLSRKMADVVIEHGLCNVTHVWGQEVGMYFPGLYAGTTDLVGCYKGRPAIMDYKTARKMKTRDKIENYFCQMAAYSLAHNEVYGTEIDVGVIFMVDRAGKFQEFVIEGEEFKHYENRFIERLDTFFG